jgi:hypothetical protein
MAGEEKADRMREWLVQFKGEEEDLKALSEIFCTPNCNVGRDEEGFYYLRSSDFARIADESIREERAIELFRKTNVVARVLLGESYFGVEFDGMARIEEDGQRSRSVGISGEMRWHVRTSYNDAAPEEAESLMGRLEAQELRKIIDLFAKSLDPKNDRLSSFVLAWAALEIFVKVVFDSYSLDHISDKVRSLTDSPYSGRVKRALKNYKSKKDKYPLVVRFIVVAALAAEPPGKRVENLDRDVSDFENIYQVRNAVYHVGELDVAEASLPTATVEVQSLLSKYLRLHLDNISRKILTR